MKNSLIIKMPKLNTQGDTVEVVAKRYSDFGGSSVSGPYDPAMLILNFDKSVLVGVVFSGGLIQTLKTLREQYGTGLKETKEGVDTAKDEGASWFPHKFDKPNFKLVDEVPTIETLLRDVAKLLPYASSLQVNIAGTGPSI